MKKIIALLPLVAALALVFSTKPAQATYAPTLGTVHYCNLYKTANQSYTTPASTPITWDAEEQNTGGSAFHSTSTNNDRITAQLPGVYLCVCTFVATSNSGNPGWSPRLYVNGTMWSEGACNDVSAAGGQNQSRWIVNLSAGDYVQFVYFDAATSRTISGGNVTLTSCSVGRVGFAGPGSVGGVFNTTATVSIPNNTLTTISWNSEILNTGGTSFHSTSTNPSRLIATTPGLYFFTCNTNWTANGGSYRYTTILINGVQKNSGVCPATNSDAAVQRNCFLYFMRAGDYAEIQVKQATGAALNCSPDIEACVVATASRGYDPVTYRGAYACVQNSTNPTVSNSTTTTLSWNTDLVNTLGSSLHSTVTNTSRINVPAAGWCLCCGVIDYAGNGTNSRFQVLAKTGSPYLNGSQLKTNNGVQPYIGSDVWIANAASATDYFELTTFQNSGGGLVLTCGTGATTYTSRFMFAWVCR